jgi:hypothetical protein
VIVSQFHNDSNSNKIVLQTTSSTVSLHLTYANSNRVVHDSKITVSLHLTYISNDRRNQDHSSLNFFFAGVIFFFFPFAGVFSGVAAAWDAAWLLVTGPGLLVVAAFLGLVGVDGTALLTETSNPGDVKEPCC